MEPLNKEPKDPAILNILVISTNPDLLTVLLRLVNQHEGWNGVGVDTPELARESFKYGYFQVVLFDVGFTDDIDKQLAKEFGEQKPDILMIQHYGGGSGLLYNEIQYALSKGERGVLLDAPHS